MNETRYLVDNNALIAIKGERIRTQYFAEHCSITEEVLWEASERPERDELEAVLVPTTASSFEWLRAVMQSVPVVDVSLVNLYANKGAADPGLVATVLDQVASDADKFFADEWVIVTEDQAVAAKATEFGISTMSGASLAAVIDESRA